MAGVARTGSVRRIPGRFAIEIMPTISKSYGDLSDCHRPAIGKFLAVRAVALDSVTMLTTYRSGGRIGVGKSMFVGTHTGCRNAPA